MRFEDPTYLWLLCLLPLLFLLRVASHFKQKKRLRQLGDPQLLKQLMPDVSKARRAVKFWLMMGALAMLILVLALVGLNVMFLLFAGTVLAAVIGMLLGKFDTFGALDLLGKGTLGMSETLIVAILPGGLFKTVQANGGILWLTEKIAKLVRGPRSCEFGMGLLVALVNFFTANNTVAIVIAGPIAKTCSDRFKADPIRMASILDTASCIVQGIIPYGAQILIAIGIAKGAEAAVGSFDLITCLYYQPMLALAVLLSLILRRKSSEDGVDACAVESVGA